MNWLRQWRRQRVLRRHGVDESLWRSVILSVPFLGELDRDESRRLRDLVVLFLAEKHFSGARGLAVTDAMRVAIAAQACLPILELGIDWYAGWQEIVVYPGDFLARRVYTDDDGVVHEYDDELSGETLEGGPVVLSWDASRGGTYVQDMNVVIHEFAHKLDMLNGVADGYPPLHADMDRKRWHHVFDVAYRGFCDALDRGRDTWLDPYAAEHPAEFFAVLSEAFFCMPHETKQRYPDAYDELRSFYRQDTARREAR